MGYTRTVNPSFLPVTVADLKAQVVVESEDDDSLLELYIEAVSDALEDQRDVAFITQTWTRTLCGFHEDGGCFIRLEKWPVSSVSSITYYDTANVSQTWTSTEYKVDTTGAKTRITPAYGYVFPSTYQRYDAATITFVAGFGTTGAVPKRHRQEILLLASELFDKREATVSSMGRTIDKNMVLDMLSAGNKMPGFV